MTITYSQALTTVETTIANGWTNTPVAYDNVEPLDYSDVARPLLSAGQDPYIGVKVIFSDSYAAETGPNAIKRTWGYISTSFYTKQAQGTRANQANIDAMCGLFEYKVISGIVFKELSVMAPLSSEGWYVTPTMLRFYFNR